MEDWLRNMGDWCISRKRYWGLPLPFYFCPDGHMTVIGSREELAERALRGLDAVEELHRPWIDEVVIGCAECGAEAKRLPDVGDCWLDAGIIPFSTLGWGNDTFVEHGYAAGAGEGLTIADLPTHEDWETLVPGRLGDRDARADPAVVLLDAVHERRPHGRHAVQAGVAHEKVNDETGRPMHKSWGNAIWFDDAVESMGADVMRWMYANQTPGQNLSFGYGPADQVKRRLLTLWNSYAFFVTYARIDDYRPSYEMLASGPEGDALQPLDRWLLARTQQMVEECRAALDAYDSPRLVRAVEAQIDDQSTWYVRLSRGRFWKYADDAGKRAAYDTLWYALVQLSRSVAPVMPFLADELWQNLVRGVCDEAPDCVHHSGYPAVHPMLANDALVAEMDSVRTVVELGRRARDAASVNLRQPLATLAVATDDPEKRARIERHAGLIAAELSVKEVRAATSAEEFAEASVMPLLKLLGPKYGRDLGMIQGLLREGEFRIAGDRVEVGDWVLEPASTSCGRRPARASPCSTMTATSVALDTEITPELALEGLPATSSAAST